MTNADILHRKVQVLNTQLERLRQVGDSNIVAVFDEMKDLADTLNSILRKTDNAITLALYLSESSENNGNN